MCVLVHRPPDPLTSDGELTEETAQSAPTSPAWQTDPGYQAALAAEQQGQAASGSQTQAAIDQLLAQFGDPNFASWAGFNDPAAAALAHQTTLSGHSILAQLQQQHVLARRAVVNGLAAHGILRSGDLGYRTGLADQAYSNSVYGAEQQLLQQIAGLQNSQLSTTNQLHQGVVSAIQQAYQNFVANPQLYTTAIPQAASASANAPAGQPALPGTAAPHRRVAAHLRNAYTTGQKLYG